MRTNFFGGSKSFFWRKSSALEVFKFSLYLLIPVGCSLVYANPEAMKALILKLNYISYPKANPTIQWGRRDGTEGGRGAS
mmetsp:Transcript_22048/g.36937  ORF Transcript_22048/g.36937 Transcript_22048/m.36937 type:complete len:80 (-) Transcript_22048:1227-1466(-)